MTNKEFAGQLEKRTLEFNKKLWDYYQKKTQN